LRLQRYEMIKRSFFFPWSYQVLNIRRFNSKFVMQVFFCYLSWIMVFFRSFVGAVSDPLGDRVEYCSKKCFILKKQFPITRSLSSKI
jgi:hypothetical protein